MHVWHRVPIYLLQPVVYILHLAAQALQAPLILPYHVRHTWLAMMVLHDGMPCRYLLVIDLDTGDVMTLLMHASELFGDNYSRKLSNIKYSTVTPMAGHALEAQLTGMCWEPAFESPYHVKAAIRTMMPDISSVLPVLVRLQQVCMPGSLRIC